MADRSTFSHLSSPPPTGLQFLEQYADRMGQLFTTAIWPLTSIGGTGDAVTATLDPPLLGGLIAGMKVTLTWAATNSAGMTLALNGGPAVPVLQADGSAMAGSAATAGTRVLLEYVGAAWRVIGGSASGASAAPYFTAITASTTWTKPTGYADDAMVLIEAWGGGGPGARTGTSAGGAGGGGGAYAARWMRYAGLPASLSVVIAAGGAPGSDGGDTTVGALLTAFGGGRAITGTAGAGGGELGKATASAAGPIGGGIAPGGPALTLWGGGAGGDSPTAAPALSGGGAVMGGGGGGCGGSVPKAGGASLRGGAGGAGGGSGTAGAGTAPGGGGGGASTGTAGAGARGEVRLWIFG